MPDAPEAGQALLVSGFQVAIASGALLGGRVVDGWGISSTMVMSGGLVLVARADRRSRWAVRAAPPWRPERQLSSAAGTPAWRARPLAGPARAIASSTTRRPLSTGLSRRSTIASVRDMGGTSRLIFSSG